jgi:hypothetical protein
MSIFSIKNGKHFLCNKSTKLINIVFKHPVASIYHIYNDISMSLMQLITVMLLHLQHVLAIHSHYQVTTTMLTLLPCMMCHNFISKLKIKIGQPLLILVKTS